METVTIKDLLLDKLKIGRQSDNNQFIYVFRKKDIVFYVGYARDVLRRFKSHLKDHRKRAPDHIGKLINDNKPLSDDWTFEVYTFEECKNVVRKYFPSEYNIFKQNLKTKNPGTWLKREWKIPEKAMIRHLYPCLNGFVNENPTALPKDLKIHESIREHIAEFARRREKRKGE